MKIVRIAKAAPVSGPIEDLVVMVGHPAALLHKNLEDAATFFKQEGEELANALYNSLPGGTMDQLLAALLRRRASLFVIPFPKLEEAK